MANTGVEYWQGILSQCSSSGLSQKEFCKRNNLTYTAFRYWWRRINRAQAQGGENQTPVLVGRGLPDPGESLQYTLEWLGGMKMRIPAGLPSEELDTPENPFEFRFIPLKIT